MMQIRGLNARTFLLSFGGQQGESIGVVKIDGPFVSVVMPMGLSKKRVGHASRNGRRFRQLTQQKRRSENCAFRFSRW
jgi:hypothetical protein